jgi:GTP:adenosylcobinamide-phosphate guanylyltransferase
MADEDNAMIRVPAIVLAGGINSPAMAAATGVQIRALVELTPGKTMLDYVLKAVTSARSVSEVIVVGNVPRSDEYVTLPSSQTFLQNLIKGVQAVPAGADKVLIVTSDIPFVNAVAIDDFVQLALYSRADFCYPVIPMPIYRKTFSMMKRTTLRLADGEFTGGNIMLMSADYVKKHQKTIINAYAARKNVFTLGSMLGWDVFGKIIVSQLGAPNVLSIEMLERGVSRLLGHGAKAKAIITEYPSLGTDVDKPADVAVARHILGRQ